MRRGRTARTGPSLSSPRAYPLPLTLPRSGALRPSPCPIRLRPRRRAGTKRTSRARRPLSSSRPSASPPSSRSSTQRPGASALPSGAAQVDAAWAVRGHG
eukprot:scaffold150225_cov33-Tisochrysis_lutea.AAC.2